MIVTEFDQLGSDETPERPRIAPGLPPDWLAWDDSTRGAYVVSALTVSPDRAQFAALGRALRDALPIDLTDIFRKPTRHRRR